MVEMIIMIMFEFAIFMACLLIFALIIRKEFHNYLEIKNKEIKNKKYELYNNVNLETVNTVIDTYIQGYVDRYVLYKFIANKVLYINQDATNEMIKDVTTNIAIDISDIMLYYISLVFAYDSDEDLIRFIRNKVTNSAIEYVTNYNNTNIPAT
ncbi:MAG: hypothetical protein IKR19_07790 [Acholeplasmatales bacterium]|nr:hypothetical protein [Acholeplasmatales bacterium]